MNIRLVALSVVALIGTGGPVAAQSRPPQVPRLELDVMWPKPLPRYTILGSVVGLAVDARDHVFVVHLTDSFNARNEIGRTANPPIGDCCMAAANVLEFDPSGALVAQWGGPGPGFAWPNSNHGIAIDAKNNVWIGGGGAADAHLVKFTRDGKFVAQVGTADPGPTPPPPPVDPAAAAPAAGRGGGRGGGGGAGARSGCGGGPGTALMPNSASMKGFGGAAAISFDAAANEAFVADGCRNRRVAVVDMNSGEIKRFWGAYGEAPVDGPSTPYSADAAPSKQFGVVRCAEVSKDGHVYVCDRTNNRIQVFRKNGTFVKEKVLLPRTLGEGSVWDVAFSHDPQQRFLFVADGQNARVHILNRETLEHLTSFGAGGRPPGHFTGLHSVAVDSKGNVYTAEAFEGKKIQKYLYKGLGASPGPQMGSLRPGGR